MFDTASKHLPTDSVKRPETPDTDGADEREAVNEIRTYGVGIDTPIDIHEQVLPLIDQISGVLMRAAVTSPAFAD